MRTLSSKLPGRKAPGQRIRRRSLVDRVMDELSGPLCFVPESHPAARHAAEVRAGYPAAEASLF